MTSGYAKVESADTFTEATPLLSAPAEITKVAPLTDVHVPVTV